MRKILYSPGFGAGWSTWNSGEVAKYMLTYRPIIDAIESNDNIALNKAVKQLEQDCRDKFGVDYVCTLGADKLEVVEVPGRVHIDEYDGSESVEREGEQPDNYWL